MTSLLRILSVLSVFLLVACGLNSSSNLDLPDKEEEIVESSSEEQVEENQDVFAEAVNYAIAAGEAAQTARNIYEWHDVATLWSKAIEQMKAVPDTHESYAVAQSKANEYLPNMEYAKKNAQVILETTTSISGNQVVVSGTTNLPDGFLLSVSGSRYHIEDDGPHEMSTIHTRSSQKVEVTNGSFQAEVTVPTVQEVRKELIEFAEVIQEPELAKSPINNHVDLNITGTPKSQDGSTLQLIGGEKGELLVGPNTEDAVGGAFRVVRYESQLNM